MVIALGIHLFPFRTEKLSPSAPMVLHTRGRVGSRRFSRRRDLVRNNRVSFVIYPRVSERKGEKGLAKLDELMLINLRVNECRVKLA